MTTCKSFQQLYAIKTATMEARQRLDDWTIGTRVENGKIQVIRWIPESDEIIQLSDWMPVNKVFGYLSAMTR